MPKCIPNLASKLIQKVLNVNPHLRPTAQEFLQDEWFYSLGLIKKKPLADIKFKEQVEPETERTLDRRETEKRDLQRNLSQGRAIADKISSTVSKTSSRHIQSGNGGLMSSTSVGKYFSENSSQQFNASKTTGNFNNANNFSQTMKITTSAVEQISPTGDKKEYTGHSLQLRSASRGREEDEQNRLKNKAIAEYNSTNTYASPVMTSSDLSRRNTQDLTKHLDERKGLTGSQINNYISNTPTITNLPPKQLYPLVSTQAQSNITMSDPPIHHHVFAAMSNNQAGGYQSGIKAQTELYGQTANMSDLSSPILTPHTSSTPQQFAFQPQSSPTYQDGQSGGQTQIPGTVSQSSNSSARLPKPTQPNQTTNFQYQQVQPIQSLSQPPSNHDQTSIARIGELERQLSDSEHRNSVLSQAVKDLKKENNRLKTGLEAAAEKCGEMDKFSTEIERLERELETRRKELDEKKMEVNGIQADCALFKNQFIELARYIRANIKENWMVCSCTNLAKL